MSLCAQLHSLQLALETGGFSAAREEDGLLCELGETENDVLFLLSCL